MYLFYKIGTLEVHFQKLRNYETTSGTYVLLNFSMSFLLMVSPPLVFIQLSVGTLYLWMATVRTRPAPNSKFDRTRIGRISGQPTNSYNTTVSR